MISTSNVTLRVGKKALLKMLISSSRKATAMASSVQTVPENPHFLRILSGQLEPTSGEVIITPGQRLSFYNRTISNMTSIPLWIPLSWEMPVCMRS